MRSIEWTGVAPTRPGARRYRKLPSERRGTAAAHRDRLDETCPIVIAGSLQRQLVECAARIPPVKRGKSGIVQWDASLGRVVASTSIRHPETNFNPHFTGVLLQRNKTLR
jgi:hypothetical protein